MASVIWHSFKQINQQGFVKLFKSHKEGYKDGQQLRDFVYVKDVLKICYWLMSQFTTGNASASAQHQLANGLYNLGTGKARSFADLATATFRGLDKEPSIEYIDMPEDIRDKYQYFTEANMQKLKDAGYTDAFYSLEEGVNDYVRNYLREGKYY
jgi:ADP-L-glycero-D-manno-heptose 6-epimerase